MQTLVGVYDLTRSHGTLGSLLILLEEMQIKCFDLGCESFDLVVVNDVSTLLNYGVLGSDMKPTERIESDNKKIEFLSRLAYAINGTKKVYACTHGEESRRAAALLALKKGVVVWPDPAKLLNGLHNYDSTINIQATFGRSNCIPFLSVADGTRDRIRWFIDKMCNTSFSLAVHLKNNPAAPGQSNADLAAWRDFFLKCSDTTRFFIVGDDDDGGLFAECSNVILVKNHGFSVQEYLGFVQECDAFMGMMSGIANMALFGRKPYAIFKNPTHHTEEMLAEIGQADCYPFGLPGQIVLREWDVTEHLLRAYKRVVEKIRINQ